LQVQQPLAAPPALLLSSLKERGYADYVPVQHDLELFVVGNTAAFYWEEENDEGRLHKFWDMGRITQVRWVAGQTGKVVKEACIRYEKESVEQWHHCSAGTYNRIWSFTGRIAPEPSAHKSNRGASRAVAEDSSEEDNFPLDRRAVQREQREQRASRAKAQAKALQKAAEGNDDDALFEKAPSPSSGESGSEWERDE